MKYDATRRCPKCGHHANTEFVSGICGEHLKRSCLRCGHHWLEEPLDSDSVDRRIKKEER